MQNTAGKIPLAMAVLLSVTGKLLDKVKILLFFANGSNTCLYGSCLCLDKQKVDFQQSD